MGAVFEAVRAKSGSGDSFGVGRRASRWNLRGRTELTRRFHFAAFWAATYQSLVEMRAHVRAAPLRAVVRARPAARRGLASVVSGTALNIIRQSLETGIRAMFPGPSQRSYRR